MNIRQSGFSGRTRRDFLHNVGAGFSGLALTGMLGSEGFFNSASAAEKTLLNPLAPKKPHYKAKAKSVIFLYMYGGPSQVDTFDYKPKLYPLDGKTIDIKTFGRGGRKSKGRVVGPKWKFKQHGQCGKYVSSLFPHLATCVDDISFLHSMTADSPIHGSAMLMMNSGKVISGSPSLGSWVNYGLGSVNQNLPGYVVMLDKTGGPISGAKNWSSGYMPASYQGTIFNTGKTPIMNLKHTNGMPKNEQVNILDSLNKLNTVHNNGREHNTNLAARISAYELAYKMQTTAPEATNIDKEPEHVKKLYGIDGSRTDDFGRKCLLARRLVERGVRFIQIYSGGHHNDNNWDAHGDLEKNHNKHCGNTDKPIAGLLKDLKQRGMLEDTLIIWGGEFGRQPTAEYAKGTGRDHNAAGFTTWMAGGGIKGGVSYGETDELGGQAVVNRLHVRNMHATVLHQMGLDPNHLSYMYNGLDQKLIGVEEVEPIHDIIA
jgi:hypothetical protein